MVGGTRIHRQIHERALVEMKEREEFLLGEENTSPAARTLFVSLDRADAIIEGGPDVSSEDELGCPTCRGYTWVFAFLLGRRNLCGILFCRGCDFEFSFHAIHTIGLKFTIDKHTKSMVPLRVLSRTNLARFALSTSSISFTSFRLRTLFLSLRSFFDSRPLFSITSVLFLQNTRGGIPLQELVRCTEAQKCLFVSPLPATLTHSVSRKSFPCHSYANTRDGGVTVPPVSPSVPLWLCGNPDLSPLAKGCKSTEITTLTTFRINTCKSVSKRRTLTTFRINTYKKPRGGGAPTRAPLQLPASSTQPPEPHAPRSASIPRDLSRLRILPVTTGVWGCR